MQRPAVREISYYPVGAVKSDQRAVFALPARVYGFGGNGSGETILLAGCFDQPADRPTDGRFDRE